MKTLFGWKHYDRLLPHRFALLQHDWTQADAVALLDDVTAILRDKRFHSALSLLPQMAGLPETTETGRRRQSILSMEGDGHARLRRLVRSQRPRAAEAPAALLPRPPGQGDQGHRHHAQDDAEDECLERLDWYLKSSLRVSRRQSRITASRGGGDFVHRCESGNWRV